MMMGVVTSGETILAYLSIGGSLLALQEPVLQGAPHHRSRTPPADSVTPGGPFRQPRPLDLPIGRPPNDRALHPLAFGP